MSHTAIGPYETLLDAIDCDVLLEALDAELPEVAQHCRRVGELAIELAELAGLNQDEQLLVAAAGAMHDVGKLSPRVRDVIGLPRVLTDQERAIVGQHTVIGQRMVEALPSRGLSRQDRALRQSVAGLVGDHHREITGLDATNRRSALLVVLEMADVADALTDPKRPYRQPASPSELRTVLTNDFRGLDSRRLRLEPEELIGRLVSTRELSQAAA
jgi:HD-GYP domain-containing protein (c-di-GMP phosphodiesterase class II)